MLPSSVHAWLSPKNPLGRVDAALEQALGMPSPSGLRAPLRSRGISLPPSFPPSPCPSPPCPIPGRASGSRRASACAAAAGAEALRLGTRRRTEPGTGD